MLPVEESAEQIQPDAAEGVSSTNPDDGRARQLVVVDPHRDRLLAALQRRPYPIPVVPNFVYAVVQFIISPYPYRLCSWPYVEIEYLVRRYDIDRINLVWTARGASIHVEYKGIRMLFVVLYFTDISWCIAYTNDMRREERLRGRRFHFNE